MSQDRIERDTLIAAPMERVWSLVSEPGWWAVDDPQTVSGTVAREGDSMVATNIYGDYPVRVETVKPPTYVAFRWASAYAGQELRDDNTTLVEFTLSSEGDKTRLRVTESGFAALAGSSELREKALEDNTGGWAEMLDNVKTRSELPA